MTVLSYDRRGALGGPAVLLLHGWPGDRHDVDEVAGLLANDHDLIVPDLRGFGESRLPPDELPDGVGVEAQVAALVQLLDSASSSQVVVAGYDVGSVVGQSLAAQHPELVRALVVTPPLPGAGNRVLVPGQLAEYWYQDFHELALSERLLDADAAAVRSYLEHFWTHWSGSGWEPPAAHLDRLAEAYAAPGAFTSSIGWYRATAGTVAGAVAEEPPAREDRMDTPLRVLWPQEDPLFPLGWSDRLDDWFADVTSTPVSGGHFVPLEAPGAMADAIRAFTGS